MANNNSVILTGNLGQCPEIYQDKNGRKFVRFSLATTDSYKDQNEQWQPAETIWHTCFAYGQAAAYAHGYRKGDRVKVMGKLSYQKTGATIGGESRQFNTATITVRRIEDARLKQNLEQAVA